MRLNKVVRALMDRAEAATGAQDSGYGLFQTTVMLQEQVRLRTEEVEAALRDNERTTSSPPASAASDMHTLRRTAALQIQLLELVVAAEGPRRADRPGRRAAGHADRALRRPRARAAQLARRRLARPRAAPVVGVCCSARALAPSSAWSTTAASAIYYRDILVMDRVERVLAAVAPHRQAPEFADASLSFLQQLVTLDVLRRRDELAMQPARAPPTAAATSLAGDGAPDELRARLQEQGFDDEGAWRIAVVELTIGAGLARRQRSRARGPRSGSSTGCCAPSTTSSAGAARRF